MQPAEQVERRSANRVEVRERVAVSDRDRNEYVRDISRSGVFIETRTPQAVGTKIALRLTILTDEHRVLEGLGEVVRVVAPGGRGIPGMGVKFQSLTEDSSQLIEALTTPG